MTASPAEPPSEPSSESLSEPPPPESLSPEAQTFKPTSELLSESQTSERLTLDRQSSDPIARSPVRPIALPNLEEVWLQTLGWTPTAAQQAQFQALYDAILEANSRVNLTRIVEPEAFWEKHIWDSLSGLHALDRCLATALDVGLADRADWSADKPVQAIDIGTGGGFPGLPIAIVRPQWSVTLLDATQKKIRAVQEAIAAIGLTNCTTAIGRAEHQCQQPQHAERYDLATVRAVGSIQACVDYTLPFLIDDGIAILYRGRWSEDDRTQLQRSLKPWEGRLLTVDAFETPLTQAVRHCVFVQV